LFDPATDMGLERQQEDFGQTLGRWGVPPGPYLVLPLLGPSDVRDGFAKPLDLMAGPSAVAQTTAQSTGITVMQVVDTRANLLDASRMLDDIALDKYSFLRDAYLARRRNLVYDGNPPDEPEAAEPAEAEASAPAAK
jgi:phospholipid-binding lipoprotein MlaA